jgi:hypothetical protein
VLPLSLPVVKTPPPLDPSGSAAAWPRTTAAITLPWDVAQARAARNATTVHVATDGKMFYVRFDAQQQEPVVASQHSDDLITGGTNVASSTPGSIAWSDDSVWVDLWPTGSGGFEYQFESNAIGAHNESSSENADFAPQWQSDGSRNGGGYTVTMAIPLAVIHGAHAGTWRVQFARYVRSTGEVDVWSYDSSQTSPDDPARAGDVTVPVVMRPPLPKPRVGVYGLADQASRSAGGSSTRFGADYSLPVTQTAAIFGTVHPDYSNVELDQQSISPSVYQRIFNEVRPFFTQAAAYFDDFDCESCGGYRTTLYTFDIPTPLDGYAFEGKEGEYGLAAFDAVGSGRTDAAGAFDFTSDDTHWNAAVQHVAADLPGLVDDSNEAGVKWWNGKYLTTYVDYATDSGTDVTDPSQGDWVAAGGGFTNQQFMLFGSLRQVGSQFEPVDGFDSHPGVAGYGVSSARIWVFAPQDVLSSAGAFSYMDRYQGVTDGQAQSDNDLILDFLTKDTLDVQLSTGSDYWRFGSDLTPISQNAGVSITYHSGMQNNVSGFGAHGPSATPTTLQYYTGRYGEGRLDTWFRSSTMRVGSRGSVTFTADNTAQWLHETPDNIQWFDGVSYAYQATAASSFAIGLRRVTGDPPVPNGGGDCIGDCSNVSIAYHLRLRQEEFYLAYGDPNTLVTVPQALFKVIFYFGGQKGT